MIGVITSWEFHEGGDGRYTLDTGNVLDLNVNDEPGVPETPRLTRTGIKTGSARAGESIRANSSLLLAGHDPDGTLWYAAAQERDDEECPFATSADRVDDGGDELRFSTGLVLPKSPAFSFDLDWYPYAGNEFPLGPADTICLDRSGVAVFVMLAGGGELTGLNFILPFIYGGLLLVAVLSLVFVILIARRRRLRSGA